MFSLSSKYTIFFTLPLLSYLGYSFFMNMNSYGYSYWSLIDTVDFFIHEFGHILFSIFGNQFLSVVGGTLLQLFIPTSLLLLFLKQEDFFAVAFSLIWIGTNMFYISTYAGDAIQMNLPLVGIGSGDIIHDWFFMFTKLGIIEYTDLISNLFYYLAILFSLLGLTYGILLIVNRIRNGKI